MASRVKPIVPMGDAESEGAALQHSPWRNRANLSSGLESIESFLSAASFDRAPWAVVGLFCGIAAWFNLPNAAMWLGWICGCLAGVLLVLAAIPRHGALPYLRQSLVVVLGMAALGTGLVWSKSALIGAQPLERTRVESIEARLLDRAEQPALHRVRLTLAARDVETGRAIKVRLNLDQDLDHSTLQPGALVRLRARLVPPASPMLPGGYDFARTAWFSGLSATGSVLGPVTVVAKGEQGGLLARTQQELSRHVRANLGGSPGTIAAAFASGDRGAIAEADEDAMRDAGLTHLLSISGLHVSAVIAAAYLLTLRILALVPWIALRVRLPLAAAASGAATGVFYTLLTGAEVPTIRSCIGALLVLMALALGREALSMRMLAVGALTILLVWPEALVGPSFQMSFAAVTAIVALHGTPRVRGWFAAREEPWYAKLARQIGALLLTGIVIELVLLPIGLFHFHRAGIYGALANVVAIPLTTFVSMPLIALALVADLGGMGAPLCWLAGKSLELLLALAHWTASWPGAVTHLPAMGRGAFALFVAGGLWLGLWRSRARLWGLGPALAGCGLLAFSTAPDVLISSDGRHVGITGEGEELLVVRDSRSDFARDNLTEIAGMDGDVRLLSNWPGAECNGDFCTITLRRNNRDWHFLIARGTDFVDERALAAACDRVDVLIAARYLPRSCRPGWLKADRKMLDQTGGLALRLDRGEVETVAQDQGEHGWWNPRYRAISKDRPAAFSSSPSPHTPAVPNPDRRGQ